MVEYLSYDEVVTIHDNIISTQGVSAGIKDAGALALTWMLFIPKGSATLWPTGSASARTGPLHCRHNGCAVPLGSVGLVPRGSVRLPVHGLCHQRALCDGWD